MKLYTIIIFLLLVTISYASEDAVKKYRNYTPEQLSKLSKEEISGSVPMMYTMAAQRGLSEGSDLLFGMDLNILMYPGLHDYKKSVNAFQTDLGDKPTGVLTVWQIHKLEQMAEMQKLSKVLFPDEFFSYISDSSAIVKGTIKLLDENIAYPINHVTIKCFRAEKYCEYDQINLGAPKEGSWSQNFQVIKNDTEYYKVIRWEGESIDGIYDQESGKCRTTSINFNFKTKEFLFITRNAGGDCKVLGVEMPKLEKPRLGQVVDGEKIISSKFAEIQKAAYDSLSSAFRAKIDKLLSKDKAKKK